MAFNDERDEVYITGNVDGTVDLNPSGGGGSSANADVFVLELTAASGLFVAASFETLPDTQALGITSGGSEIWNVALTEVDGSGESTGYQWDPSTSPIAESDVGLAGVAYTDFTGFPTTIYAGYTETNNPFGFSISQPGDKDCIVVVFDDGGQTRWLLHGNPATGGTCQLRAVSTKGHILQVVGELQSLLGATFSGSSVSGCGAATYAFLSLPTMTLMLTHAGG